MSGKGRGMLVLRRSRSLVLIQFCPLKSAVLLVLRISGFFESGIVGIPSPYQSSAP